AGMARQFDIPEAVVNSDAYLYFENRRQGGTFRSAIEAVVYNRSPRTMAEHEKQSKRFQSSAGELTQYFSEIDLADEYHVPAEVKSRALRRELLANPLYTLLYLGIFGYTRFRQWV